jgi:hypothetical protein
MVGTAFINVEHGVVGLTAEADAIEEAALLNQAIAQGIAGFSLPVGFSAWFWMVGPDVVIAMGKQLEKVTVPVLDEEKFFG